MAQVPYPLTGESFDEFKSQVYELVRQVYEEKIGGADLGDVFSLVGDVLTLVLATSSGLTKSGNALALSPTSTGGLQISSSGASLKLLSTGGLESSASGLNIKILSTGGLQTDSTGTSIKCKTGGGTTTDADGLSVVASGVAHSGLAGLTTGDDHTQYRLEAADHTHQTTGLQAGQIDHGLAMVAASLLDDDHTQYQKESEKDGASGYAGLNASSRTIKGVDTTDDIVIDSITTGLVLKDSATPAHYWRVTIGTDGVIDTTDLGHTKP